MKYLWDFLFGVLLIGGAPWSFLALFIVGGDFLQAHTHFVIPDVLTGAVIILSFFAFGAAVAYRFKKRSLPKAFIIGEILLGVAWAILLLGFYGVIMHSIID